MIARLDLFLAAVLLGCALGLVKAQHEARSLFITLEQTQTQAKELEVAWTQLQLEQSRLGQHARVEVHARKKLDMVSAAPAKTRYLAMEVR